MASNTTHGKARSGFWRRWSGRRERHRRHSEIGHGALGDNCVALCCSRRGQCLSVSQLTNEVQEAAQLRDLGVREGAVVTVLRSGNPLLVGVNGARFGIGHAAAMHILCDIIEKPCDTNRGTPCTKPARR